MPTEARKQAFRKRWNVQIEPEKEFDRFCIRLLQELEQAIEESGLSYSQLLDIDAEFCYILGTYPFEPDPGPFDRTNFQDTTINNLIYASEDLRQLIGVIQHMFWAIEEKAPDVLPAFTKKIKRAIDHSPTIDIRIMLRQDQATLYPAGARLLDEALVNDTLVWLEEHPTVAKHFDEALQIYLHQDTAKYRNLLDNLRFSMEQLLRSILYNRKSLENQKEPLLSWLKERSTHQQIINMYQTILAQFAQYQNDAVKHGEAFSPAETEFIIYLTGAFMRFVLRLHEESQTAPPVEN